MILTQELKTLSANASERIKYISDEKTTKQALIMPFFQSLGFDIFNPLEFMPDYKTGCADKIDYAILKDNEPIIFITAKSLTENLTLHYKSTSTYFNSTPTVNLAILTNGIEYEFYTDLNHKDIMDTTPFFKFNLLNLKDSDIQALNRFTKNNFNKESLSILAPNLMQVNILAEISLYNGIINKGLTDLFKNPSDEFIEFIITNILKIKLTTNIFNDLKPLIKISISNTTLNLISEELHQDEELTLLKDTSDTKNTSFKNHNTNIPSPEELAALEITKEILSKNNKDIKNITCKSTSNYFSIYLSNPTKWILRFNLDSNKKKVITKLPLNILKNEYPYYKVEPCPRSIGTSRIYIKSPKDLVNLEWCILKAYDIIKIR